MFKRTTGRISQAPTNPRTQQENQGFDVADLYSDSSITTGDATAQSSPALDEKLRQAYFWIVNSAIISPYYDIEYNDTPPVSFGFGDRNGRLTLPTGQSYASFVLLPLLNLVVRGRCLLVGGPGRGKTASATLMGLLSGYSAQEVKRATQHGQPQMTVTDLLGNPLPKDMVGADSMDDIRIAWRKWLGMRVKVIDEYNRIPTRTQSALLTLMGDNYAELLDQIYECPPAAWYLTANDDAGGGTYQVIEALRDRIDIVVKALHFSPRFLGDLLTRVEADVRPEDTLPEEIIFSEEEIEQAHREIRAVAIPTPLLRRLEFFCSQFEFADQAADQFEYKTKDTIKLSGLDFSQILGRDTSRDQIKDPGSQTRNGMSVRALMTMLEFIKAVAYFRGESNASMEDVRQMIPFVLHDKLVPNLDSPFFEQNDNQAYRVDRISWLRRLFDLSCEEYERLDLDHDDPVTELGIEFKRGLDGLSERTVEQRLTRIEKILREWSENSKLYGPMYDDILKLKYLHQRYTNYLRWLKWQP